MWIFVFFILLIAVIVIIYGKFPVTIASHWQHFYDDCQIPTQEFYSAIQDGFRERKLGELKIEQETFLQTHLFSERRVYLRIKESERVFYVCAAPFSTGTFISWWLCIEEERMINNIPYLNKIFGKDRKNKTFYQMDTEAMYKSVIHSTVMSAAETFTSNKGIRLNDLERQYNNTIR